MNGESVWSAALTAAEELEELRRAHRADGVLTAAEDALEGDFLRLRLVHSIGDAHDALAIAQAIGHRGPESERARRLMAQRARRLATVHPFPGDRYGLGDDDAVAA